MNGPKSSQPAYMSTILLSGASGFLGRTLVPLLLQEHDVIGIARRSRERAGIEAHPRLSWYEIDIGDGRQVGALRQALASRTSIDHVIHLAAYYDFTGEERPDYWRTNVVGLQHTLDCARALRAGHFLFASSLAACLFPASRGPLRENTPADGVHIYARTKSTGEEMVRAAASDFPVTIVRFAALFSDWCEYPPLFRWLETWLGGGWNARVLGGRGKTALPYLHVLDAASFVLRAIEDPPPARTCETLIASPDTPVSHLQLFGASTLGWFGERRTPLLVPVTLARFGVAGLHVIGRATGEVPFERGWMLDYVDQRMAVDASATRARVPWFPRERLSILRRLPFLLDRRKIDFEEWLGRNRAAMKRPMLADHLKVHALLEKHQDDIVAELHRHIGNPHDERRFASYRRLSLEEREWNHRLILHELLAAVRTAEPAVFARYCRELAARRLQQGFGPAEICAALEAVNLACLRTLRRDPDSKELRQPMLDYVTMTLRFGCDQAQDVCETGLAAR